MLVAGAPPGLAAAAAAAGFDPLQATDSALRAYGFPARPDPVRSRKAYTAWAHLVAGAKIRIAAEVKVMPHRHRPMIPSGSSSGTPRAVTNAASQFNTYYSTNWSGEALNNGATRYGTGSFHAIFAQFTVPVGQQQFGNCTGGTEYSSTWIGIDGGLGLSSDVLQAGTESDANCYGGYTTPNYYVWYEWYPDYTYEITNFPVTAGQVVSLEVTANSSTSGTAFITNLTTNQYTTVTFNAPAGTTLIGNTAEWVVERPEINNTLGTLANYGTQYMSSTIALAQGVSEGIWGGAGQLGIPVTHLTMVENNSDVSVPYWLGFDGLLVAAAGLAN